jgi:CheY-like chemotaxis protein
MGTSFFVYLPRVPADQQSAEKPPQPAPRGTEHVLFVDDEESIVQLGSRMLRDLGYKVTGETSSLRAFDLFTAGADRFDLVISDFAMPKMTGGEFIAKVRDVRPGIPAILISGFHDEAIPIDPAGGIDLVERVSKPFTRSDLAFAIRRALDRSNVTRPRD